MTRHFPILLMSLLAAAVPLRTASLNARSDYGKVVLQNKTAITLSLSVDGRFFCRAPATMTCTTQQLGGSHLLTATGERDFVRHQEIELRAGYTCTWTLAQESSETAGCGDD